MEPEPVVGEWTVMQSQESLAGGGNSPWDVVWRIINALNRSLIAVITFTVCWVALTTDKVGFFELHIALSCTGYQLLLAEAIMSLACDNGWSMTLKKETKKIFHLVLGGLGTVLAITGTSLIIYQKGANFKSTHSILGLSSLVLISVTAMNGPITYIVGRCNRRVKPVFMIIYHSSTSCATFCVGVACLITGYDKRWIKTKLPEEVILCLTIFSCITIFLTLRCPLINLAKLSYAQIRRRFVQ